MKNKTILVLICILVSTSISGQLNLKSDKTFRLESINKGLRMNDKDQISLGTNQVDDGWFGGCLRIHSLNDLGITIYNSHNFDYGDVFKVVTDRPKTTAISVWYNSKKTFTVNGDGEVYSSRLLLYLTKD